MWCMHSELQYCVRYKVDDFISAIESWVENEELDPSEVFIWVCFFCNNQYRLLSNADNLEQRKPYCSLSEKSLIA